MCTNENEVGQLGYEKFNQYLTNDGVCLFFSNVFDQISKGRVPTIKYKLRRILVDYGLCQTCMEIDQRLNYIKVWYIDEQAKELRGLLLQRLNDKEHRTSQAIELSISLEGSLVSSSSKERKIRTYTGLTKLIYQEFVQSVESSSMIDDNPFNEMETIIQKGNLAASKPLSAILAEGVR